MRGIYIWNKKEKRDKREENILKSEIQSCRPPSEYLFLILAHPWIPHTRPLDNTVFGRIRNRHPISKKITITHPSLFPQRRTILLPDEPVELALNALEAPSLSMRKLPIETLAHCLPLLTEVHAVVPNEVHFFFFVFGSRRATVLWWGARGTRNRAVAISAIRGG